MALLVAFALPWLRLLRPLWRLLRLQRLAANRWLGRCERWSWRIRELALLAVLGGGWWFAVLPPRPMVDWWIATAALLVLLTRWQQHADRRVAQQWIATRRGILPAEFFSALAALSSPAGLDRAPTDHPPTTVFDLRPARFGKPALWPLLPAALSSEYFAHTALAMTRGSNPDRGRELFDRCARSWGLAVLQAAGARLVCEGIEQLRGLRGRRILMINHVSQTDFAFAFPALDALRDSTDEIHPRFIIAKDWFVDNRFVRSVLGIGDVSLAAGMIAIDRRNQRRALVAMSEAATAIAERKIDIAIYPQGTRARPLIADDGTRQDSGYYSSAPPSAAERHDAHFKRGGAFLAIDVALALRGSDLPVHVIVIGVEGAGRVLPRTSLRLQRGQTVTYRVHEVVTITPDETVSYAGSERGAAQRRKAAALALSDRLERSLAAACRIDERLDEDHRRRFGRPLPASLAARRLYEQLLVLAPERRMTLLASWGTLPLEPTAEELRPLFASLLATVGGEPALANEDATTA
jgi:1-acyl-sn-glycerol-3-phosphate acyltransferase